MLNPNTNVGKLKNDIFNILFVYFEDGSQIEEKSIKICKVTRLGCQTGTRMIQTQLLMTGGLH